MGAYEFHIISVDIGLRMFDGTAVRTIECEPVGTLTSPLRISKGGITYGIILVPTADASASKMRIQTSTEVKAIKQQ
jgi:hypothetical protein